MSEVKMNQDIILEISKQLSVRVQQVERTLQLLEEGNTIPFISRYRKEATGNLNEEQIREINEVYMYQVNLLKRKQDVIRLIEEKDTSYVEVIKLCSAYKVKNNSNTINKQMMMDDWVFSMRKALR